MQNFIEKKRCKSIFHTFFFEKQIKNHASPFSTFIFTKRTKNCIRHNLLSESERVSLDLTYFFDLFCLKFRSF